MQSLKIGTGQIKLQIVDEDGEERGIFKFNPHDIGVANRFFSIKDEVAEKETEFHEKFENATSTGEKLALLDEVVTYFESLIDNCFGEGTSKLLFGDAKSIEMFNDFFEGITPYYAEASTDRVGKYENTIKQKRSRKSSK